MRKKKGEERPWVVRTRELMMREARGGSKLFFLLKMIKRMAMAAKN